MRYTDLHVLIGRKQMKLTGILGTASLAASYGPARRASRADPMDALRAE